MRQFGLRLVFLIILAFSSHLTAANDNAQLWRGKYIVESFGACSSCHHKDYSGGLVIKGIGFTANVPNITQDKKTGIGAWSDEEIIKAIREGERPDGSTIGMPMPIKEYRHISDRDIDAIVTYLRTIPPVSKAIAPSNYPNGLPENYGSSIGKVDDVPDSDPVAYGKYMVTVSHCLDCHTPYDAKTGKRIDTRLGAGGFEFDMGELGIAITSNLTPAGSLPFYSDAELKTIIRTGIRPDGSKLLPVMSFKHYAKIKDKDIDAIIAYLRSLESAE